MDQKQPQTSREAHLELVAARGRAECRVKDIMLPAARAIADARTPDQRGSVEEERTVPGTGVRLTWRSSGPGQWSAQIVVPGDPDATSPELFARVAAYAAACTPQICATHQARREAYVATVAAEIRAWDSIAVT